MVADDLSLSVDRGEPGSGGNRLQRSRATAFWLEDSVEFGALTVRPGVRYEYVDLHNTDFESDSSHTATAVRDGDIDAFVPGLGLSYALSETSSVFGGVYRGVSIPSPRSVLKDGVEIEESVGYELGYRQRDPDRGFQMELVGFFSDFDNLIGAAAGLGLDGESATNAGEAEVYGIEFLVGSDLGADLGHRIPVHFSATWTHAELESALSEGGADDIWSGGQAGADIPYTPEWKLAAGIGYQGDRWGASLDLSYVSDSFGTALNSEEPVDSARQGRIDDAFLVDVSAYYQLRDGVRLVGGVHNLLDEDYITSRLPEGPRSGAPQQWYLGMELEF